MTLSINDITDGAEGAPRVEVLLTGLDSGVSTVTAYRFCGGVEEPVSGIINAPVAGAGNWIDYEVPAQSATYKVEFFDVAGDSVGFSESVTIELGFDGVWIHSPFAPSGAVKVTLHDEAVRRLSRPVPGAMVRPKGRRVGVMISHPRHGLRDVVFSVYCEDLDSADRVQAFLGTESARLPPVICIRVGMDYPSIYRRIRSPLFLGVLDIPEEDQTLRYGGERTLQHIVGDEAARPAPGLFIPLLRRMDVDAYYASRGEFDDAYLTRLDANRDYSLAGFADGT